MSLRGAGSVSWSVKGLTDRKGSFASGILRPRGVCKWREEKGNELTYPGTCYLTFFFSDRKDRKPLADHPL